MKAVIIKQKCPAQPNICQPMKNCPSSAISYIEDEEEELGGRMEVDAGQCTGCGACVPLCCGDCIEMRES
ncbi:MAG: hypothetical protein P4M02_09345 [Clostridia bacterium]|nr:hypothetical protein [Clostridia bacterium]